MSQYTAYLHKNADSDYGVSFPDFPGCVTSGRTPLEARAMACEALHGHIETMVAEGLPVPLRPLIISGPLPPDVIDVFTVYRYAYIEEGQPL